MENVNIPKMMKLKAAASVSGLSYDRLRKMCLNGEIAHIRSGRDFYINTDRLADYLNNNGLK